jgi:hypothetical protein
VGKQVSSFSNISFKDMVRNKSSTPSSLIPTMLSAYIMDKIEEVPLVEISTLEITNIHTIINLRVSYVDLMGTSMLYTDLFWSRYLFSPKVYLLFLFLYSPPKGSTLKQCVLLQ